MLEKIELNGELFSASVDYYDQLTPDLQYRELISEILDSPNEIQTALEIEDANGFTRNAIARYLHMPKMEFDLRNGFPLITERKLGIKGPLGELTGFMNGAHTLDELESYGMPRFWWEPQITPEKTAKRGLEEGNLGPASYGPVLHDFPTRDGGTFNQLKAMVDQIRERPELRRHVSTTLYPPEIFRAKGYEQKVVVVPCHGSLVHVEIDNNEELTLKHVQISGDVPVGIPQNMVQYAALTVMLAQATGYKPGKYIHVISDAHIYENQFEKVEELLDTQPRPFPKLFVRDGIDVDIDYLEETGKELKDLFAFRNTDFAITDYDPHPGFRMDTAR